MGKTMKTAIQLLIALAGVVLLVASISGRIQSNWPLCGALGCMIAANVLNILRLEKRKGKREHGSD